MNGSELGAPLYDMPSVARFTDRVVDDLISHRSVLILLPDGADADRLWSRLQAELWRRECSCETLATVESPDPAAPLRTSTTWTSRSTETRRLRLAVPIPASPADTV